MIIFYDMDEVLNFMSKLAIEHYNKDFNDNFDWRNNSSWWWDDAPKANREYFIKLTNKPGFYYTAELQKDGAIFMEKLIKEGFDVRILTYPQWNGTCAQEKEMWTKHNLPFFDMEKMTMCKDKWLLAGPDRVLLDDNVKNLMEWENHGGIAVAYDHAFNKEWQGARVKNHEEFYNFIKNLKRGD